MGVILAAIMVAGVAGRPGVILRPRPEVRALSLGWYGPSNVGTGWNGFTTVFALLPRAPDVVR